MGYLSSVIGRLPVFLFPGDSEDISLGKRMLEMKRCWELRGSLAFFLSCTELGFRHLIFSLHGLSPQDCLGIIIALAFQDPSWM